MQSTVDEYHHHHPHNSIHLLNRIEHNAAARLPYTTPADFLIVLEVGNPRPRNQWGWSFLRPLALACSCPPSHWVFPPYSHSLSLQLLNGSFYGLLTDWARATGTALFQLTMLFTHSGYSFSTGTHVSPYHHHHHRKLKSSVSALTISLLRTKLPKLPCNSALS